MASNEATTTASDGAQSQNETDTAASPPPGKKGSTSGAANVAPPATAQQPDGQLPGPEGPATAAAQRQQPSADADDVPPPTRSRSSSRVGDLAGPTVPPPRSSISAGPPLVTPAEEPSDGTTAVAPDPSAQQAAAGSPTPQQSQIPTGGGGGGGAVATPASVFSTSTTSKEATAGSPPSGSSTTISTTISTTPPTTWDYSTPLPPRYFRPSLTNLCYPVLAKNFAKYPGFGNLPAHERLLVINELALDLPLQLAADLIPEEAYWKRKVHARWRNCDISAHGNSWKQLFFERNLIEALEKFDRTKEKESSLVELMRTSAPYVHNLDLNELPSHFSFLTIFNILQSQLVGLKVRFGNPNCGWNYNPKEWGIKRSDCLSLSAALSIATTLTTLHLPNNRIDAEKMGIIAEGLMANPTVVDLDLSCNCLSDGGVKEVAKVVKASNSVLGMLNLARNNITAQGCVYLAECEDVNKSLVSLNLCFNLFGDLGGKRIIDWLNNNTSIQKLNIESCDIGEDSAQSFVRLMHNTHSSLTYVNMSGNPGIGVKNGELLLTGLEAGKQMELWISNCGCGEELENKVLTFMIEKLFGRTCFHHVGVMESPQEEVAPKDDQKDAAALLEGEMNKKQEEELAKKEAEEEKQVGYELDEEEQNKKEEREKAAKEAEKAMTLKAVEDALVAKAAAKARAEKESMMVHVGHSHDEACTLECAQMVGLPSKKAPPTPVVYPEVMAASRDAQATIKAIQDEKPYWGLNAIKDLK